MSILYDLLDLQRYWQNITGHFCQSHWDTFLNFTGEDSLSLYAFGSAIVTFSVYWLIGGIYTIMDITNKPRWIKRYKIQPNTNEPLETKKLPKAIFLVLINQLVVGIPSSVLLYKAMDIRGFRPTRELPTIYLALFQFAAMILIEEIGFYYSHRLLHNRLFYKHIHKVHHEWTSPIAITAIYCHPIEHFFSNILPPILCVVITRCHLITLWLWLVLVMLSTLNAHSGYHFPFFPSPEAHNFHHLKKVKCTLKITYINLLETLNRFNSYYGVLGILDRIHGTDKLFRSTVEYHRHITMLSLVPPRQAFPDAKKNK